MLHLAKTQVRQFSITDYKHRKIHLSSVLILCINKNKGRTIFLLHSFTKQMDSSIIEVFFLILYMQVAVFILEFFVLYFYM